MNQNDQAIEQQIQAKGKTAPRITPADIEANIAGCYYFTAGAAAQNAIPEHFQALDLLTFCVLVLRNGFTVTGESACASPENFDAEIGRNIARQNAVQKIWPLMGYALKQQLHDAANRPPAPGAAHAGYSTMQPHQQRVVDEKAALDDKRTKLRNFTSTALFSSLDPAEQRRLLNQLDAMNVYGDILGDRIAAFAPAAAD